MIVAARAVHFASAILLFGGLLFVLAVATLLNLVGGLDRATSGEKLS